MCCEESYARYSSAVTRMLAAARRAPDELGADSWNGPGINRLFHVAPTPILGPPFSEDREVSTAEIAAALIAEADLGLIPGLVRLEVAERHPDWRLSAPVVAAEGARVAVPVLVSCSGPEPVRVCVGLEEATVEPGSHALLEASLAGVDCSVSATVDGHLITSPEVIARAPCGALDLSVDGGARWYVRRADGEPCFPPEAMAKWDARGQGYFHARQATLFLLPGPYRIEAVRGIEFHRFATDVLVEAGRAMKVPAVMTRRFDPHAGGWWSADLHVHANYGGDYAVSADEAMEMQACEGLDFMNLVAANNLTDHIHDLDLFQGMLDHALPTSHGTVTHAGLEYRSALYGHVHVTGAERDLGLYQSGHAQGLVREDWPLITSVVKEYVSTGAVVGYCHPVGARDARQQGLAPDDLMGRVLDDTRVRGVDARCSVLDAALGVIDSLDVLSNADDIASGALYRRMVGAGLRIAVTAGSDTMLSLRHDSVFSNPPGWLRLYARTEGSCDLPRLREAIRARRTFATNGPWIELTVNGRGPGEAVLLTQSETVCVRVHVLTDSACSVELFDGSHVLHSWSVGEGVAAEGLDLEVSVEAASSMTAMVELRGGPEDSVLGDPLMPTPVPSRWW